MNKYTIGLDYGTLSCRGIIAAVADGEQIASAHFVYPHGIMDTSLPCGTALPPGWALQHPQDYVDALHFILPELMKSSGLHPQQIIGVGVDFTSCTMLPVKADGTPLCFLPEYEGEPHAYAKLWKHHAAQNQADRITALAAQRDEPFLRRCGDKVSAQNAFPKLMQVLEEAPHIYSAMDLWVEAADWIVWQLTGRLSHGACCLQYKAFYDLREGYPKEDFFTALSPAFSGVLNTKMSGSISPVAGKAGEITANAAYVFGLSKGTAVSTPMVDGHACFPSSGITGPGTMLGILGTSAAYLMLPSSPEPIPGLCGTVDSGLVPGYWGLEAGLNCMGDHFAWAADICCPPAYAQEARERNRSIHELLTEKAQKLKPGQSGLIALDWWNGNRSVLMDADLTGLLVGMTLHTVPEEIYRALLEATAYATRLIVEHFHAHDIPVQEFRFTGGISRKNSFLMQIFADVLKMPVMVLQTEQGSALGSAIYAAAAAGEKAGGYRDLTQAILHMSSPVQQEYRPIFENSCIYDRLYPEYKALHDTFGLHNTMMKRLNHIRREASKSRNSSRK
jgi:L-ribulokinase